ncbi:unnamed protein product, partial [marine sediment metagenome]
SSSDAPELRGSEELIAALVREASRDVRTIRPGREITFRRARPFLIAAVGAAFFLGALFLLWPAVTSRLLLRAVAPYKNLPNIAASDLLVTPGDVVVTRGRVLRVEVEVADKPVRRAEFRTPSADGPEIAEPMARVFDPDESVRRFVLTCPPAAESFRYRIHAGDALSRYYTVTVVPVPAVTAMDLRYDYPAYTRRQPYVEEDSSGDIRAVAGAVVTVTARTNTVVRSAQFVVDGQALPDSRGRLSVAEDGTTTCTFRVEL